MMSPFISEFIGTAILIILGNGVVANVILHKTKGHNSGWIVITFGWAMAVFVAVYIAAAGSGAHLNPAVSLAMAMAGKFNWADLPQYVVAQLSGAMLGQYIVWLTYRDHYDATDDQGTIQATFCTSPAISNLINNFVSEMAGTFVLILGVLFITSPASSLGALDALPVALLVLAIGLSLGGTTGYAINPARDLGPRIMHFFLPLKHKGDSGWSYSWIPVFGPISGSILAVFIFNMIA
jgi:glycerol uptake facilitator protein